MDAISMFFKQNVPSYLRALPIPRTFNGFLQLSGQQWLQLVPFIGTLSLLAYALIYTLFSNPGSGKDKKKDNWVNHVQKKEVDKCADTCDIEEIDDKAVYCRCWRSKKFPYCDGSHNDHNKLTGDNVGPLIVKKKKC